MAFLFDLLKWPLAMIVVVLTPAGGLAFWDLLVEAWGRDIWLSPFGIGFIVTAIVWLLFGQVPIFRFWSTMEHELTHALFALLTLVRVIELRSTDGTLESSNDSVGHVHLGESNWLITVSPYFFPTAAAFVLAATWALASEPTNLAHGLFGAAIAYNIVSTWQETHRYQFDLGSVGIGFSCIFLPGANLLCYGFLLAYELDGANGAIQHGIIVLDVSREWIVQLFGS